MSMVLGFNNNNTVMRKSCVQKNSVEMIPKVYGLRLCQKFERFGYYKSDYIHIIVGIPDDLTYDNLNINLVELCNR